MYSALNEKLVSVEVDGSPTKGTLPEVLAWLSGGHQIRFTALQVHQQHPWHAFLVQLAAIAQARGRAPGLPTDAATWRNMLLRLTGREEAWELIVEDLRAPALLQPPVPEGSLDPLKAEYLRPDHLDVLIASKNFDLKRTRIPHDSPEYWMYALITRQTFAGYLGRYNGISRMRGGESNRPCVTLAPSLDAGARFRRDVGVWLRERAELIRRYSYNKKGHALLWLLPWDGTDSLMRTTLDPFYIEICQRVRLTVQDGKVLARTCITQEKRITKSPDFVGDTGDIWTPTRLTKGSDTVKEAYAVGKRGFTYKKIVELMFGGEWTRWPAIQWCSDDGESPLLIAQGLVRGKGVTKGYHERIVPIPPTIARLLGDDTAGALLGERAKAMVSLAGDTQRSLYASVCALFEGKAKDNVWCARFEDRVDAIFFHVLFETLDEDDATHRRIWDTHLEELFQSTLEEACREVRMPSTKRYALISRARSIAKAARWKLFPDLMKERRPQQHKDNTDDDTEDTAHEAV